MRYAAPGSMNLFLRYIPSALLVILLLLMVRNRAYRFCPAFFAYIAFGVGADIARFAVDNRHDAYYRVFWATEAGYCILGIAAMYEVFSAFLHARSRWTHFLFPGVVALALILSWAHAHSVAPQFSGFFSYILAGEITVRFVQVMAFFVIGLLAALFGLRWYHLGVAAGFGFYATAELLNMMEASDIGTKFVFLWRVYSLSAYSLAVLIWIWFFRVPPGEEPTPDLRLVVQYISALGQYFSRMRSAPMRLRM
jgi:hypothetical protein